MNKRDFNTFLLPIAIMAHNEEKLIRNSVTSALSQTNPVGFSTKVVVVANACNDKTEKIVSHLQMENPGKIILISTSEKGKTKAIKKMIKFFETNIPNSEIYIPYVIFFDADCEFIDNNVIVNFIEKFQRHSSLCAISAHCIPDVCFNRRSDLIAKLYRAIESLSRIVKMNTISGMCYCIKFEILRKMEFPDFQLAEDMFVSSRLNGWFFKDMKINVVFETPNGLRNELNRRVRQEISSQRYHDYYSYLKKNGSKVEFFDEPLAAEYRWGRISQNGIFRSWLQLPRASHKFYAIIYSIINGVARISASRKKKKVKVHKDYDYWTVDR